MTHAFVEDYAPDSDLVTIQLTSTQPSGLMQVRRCVAKHICEQIDEFLCAIQEHDLTGSELDA